MGFVGHKEKAVQSLERFGIPDLIWLGCNKDTISKVSTRKERDIWKCPFQKYLSINADFLQAGKKRRVGVIDIDDYWKHGDVWSKVVSLIQDGVIPEPLFAVGRWKTRGSERRFTRAHLIYLFEYPIDESCPKQKFKLDAVWDQFHDTLEKHGLPVDKNEMGVAFKNPAAKDHDVIFFNDRTWTLGQIGEILEIEGLEDEEYREINANRWKRRRIKAAARQVGIAGERNVEIFELSRHQVYAAKAFCVSLEHLREQAVEIVHAVSHGMGAVRPLSRGELYHIARSIAKWTWKHYTGRGDGFLRNRGACAHLITDRMDTEDRQAIGRAYTHDERTRKVVERLKNARDQIVASGERVTYPLLSKVAGVATSTAQKYRRMIERGEDFASKAEQVSREIKKRILRGMPDKTGMIAAGSMAFGPDYRDGASEVPGRGRSPKTRVESYKKSSESLVARLGEQSFKRPKGCGLQIFLGSRYPFQAISVDGATGQHAKFRNPEVRHTDLIKSKAASQTDESRNGTIDYFAVFLEQEDSQNSANDSETPLQGNVVRLGPNIRQRALGHKDRPRYHLRDGHRLVALNAKGDDIHPSRHQLSESEVQNLPLASEALRRRYLSILEQRDRMPGWGSDCSRPVGPARRVGTTAPF